MKSIILAAGTLSAIALTASAASAAPLSGAGRIVGNDSAGIVKVHGVHRECLRGRWGWHRSTPWGGRVECYPRWRRWHGWHEGSRGRDHDEDYDQPRRRRHHDDD